MAEVTSRPPSGGPPARLNGGSSSDWTVQAADTIESVVGTIREKTVIPATTAARAVVYGLVAGVLGIVLLVLVVIVSVRFGAVYLPGWFADKPGRSVWATQAIIGGILTLAGLFLVRKANAAASGSKD
jgi:hypothetical protein